MRRADYYAFASLLGYVIAMGFAMLQQWSIAAFVMATATYFRVGEVEARR